MGATFCGAPAGADPCSASLKISTASDNCRACSCRAAVAAPPWRATSTAATASWLACTGHKRLQLVVQYLVLLDGCGKLLQRALPYLRVICGEHRVADMGRLLTDFILDRGR